MMKFCKKCNCDTERYADGRCKHCHAISRAKWTAKNIDKWRSYLSDYRSSNRDKLRECSAKWRESNQDKVREIYAKCYAKNADKRREYRAKYFAENHEKCCAASAAWKAANPDRARSAREAWKKANPEKVRVFNQNRRSKVAGGKLSHGLAELLFKLQRGKCACCGEKLGDDYHLDHILPLALGGTNEDSNIQLLRSKCNLQKQAKHPIDFMQQRGFLL